jgi:hypothetical protein
MYMQLFLLNKIPFVAPLSAFLKKILVFHGFSAFKAVPRKYMHCYEEQC